MNDLWRRLFSKGIDFDMDFKEPIEVEIVTDSNGNKCLYNSITNCYFINEPQCISQINCTLEKYIENIRRTKSLSKRKYKGVFKGDRKSSSFFMVRIG